MAVRYSVCYAREPRVPGRESRFMLVQERGAFSGPVRGRTAVSVANGWRSNGAVGRYAMGRGVAGWVYVAAAAALSGSCIVLTQWWFPGAVASGACAAAAVIAVAWTACGTALTQERAGRRQAAESKVRLTHRGKLPLVRDIADPVSVGVHPAVPALLGPAGQAAAFVTRDFMAELCEALLSGQFVLLVGESAAGKSRAAFEAVREAFPDRGFVQPWGRDGVKAALDLAMEHPGCVLWADDLERFLGDGGLTGAAVRGPACRARPAQAPGRYHAR